MHLVGEGVTRNFLTILEADARRSARSLWQVAVVALLVLLGAYLALADLSTIGFAAVPLFFAAALVGGVLWTKYHLLDAYEVSLRDHWNRWMRWSVSCRTVRECYAKVHNLRPGLSPWTGALLLFGFLVTHLVFLVFVIDDLTAWPQLVPLFALDAVLIGFFAGMRVLQRRWYRKFLRSCNELLRDGSLGLWGVF